MRQSRAEYEAKWKAIVAQREAERIERERAEQERRQKRQKVGALARIRLLSQCPPDVYEAFEIYCEKVRTEWIDAPVHLDHEYLNTLPRQLFSRLMAFMHAYEGTGGTAFLWSVRAEQRRSQQSNRPTQNQRSA